MRSSRSSCHDAGMNDHVAKPIDPDRLFETLTKWTTPKQTGAEAPATEPPPAPSAGSVPGEGSLESLGGFDIEEGLGRLAGNEKLYRKLLKVFYNDKSEICSEIRDALARGDTSEAQALAHGIKGIAGNVSANRLFEVSRALDASLKDGNAEEADALMDDFERAHLEVMSSLSYLFNENASKQPAGK